MWCSALVMDLTQPIGRANLNQSRLRQRVQPGIRRQCKRDQILRLRKHVSQARGGQVMRRVEGRTRFPRLTHGHESSASHSASAWPSESPGCVVNDDLHGSFVVGSHRTLRRPTARIHPSLICAGHVLCNEFVCNTTMGTLRLTLDPYSCANVPREMGIKSRG